MIKVGNFESLCKYVMQNTMEDMLTNALMKRLTARGIYPCKDTASMMALADTVSRGFGYSLLEYTEAQIKDLKNNLEQYIWVYDNLLVDEKSKQVFFELVAYRLDVSADRLIAAYEKASPQYFDKKIINFDKNWVFVDCGALDGETVAEFIINCPSYKKIYLYEPMPVSCDICKKNIKDITFDGCIVAKEKAVYSEYCTLIFDCAKSLESSCVRESGGIDVKAVTLDDDIKEQVSFIKMDIEGSEIHAIEGSKEHIKNDTPYLAICVYHLADDIWRIPKRINEINAGYNFYIRQHNMWFDNETVLYAVPKNGKPDIYDHAEISIDRQDKRLAGSYKLLNSLKQKRNMELMEAHIWLEGQLRNYQKEINNQNQVIAEMRHWVTQLEEAKAWLEIQMNNYKYEAEQKDKVIDELHEWNSKLQAGKSWLEDQFSKYTGKEERRKE